MKVATRRTRPPPPRCRVTAEGRLCLRHLSLLLRLTFRAGQSGVAATAGAAPGSGYSRYLPLRGWAIPSSRVGFSSKFLIRCQLYMPIRTSPIILLWEDRAFLWYEHPASDRGCVSAASLGWDSVASAKDWPANLGMWGFPVHTSGEGMLLQT